MEFIWIVSHTKLNKKGKSKHVERQFKSKFKCLLFAMNPIYSKWDTLVYRQKVDKPSGLLVG